MPTYDYMCEDGHHHELIHSVSECDDEHACPKCFQIMWRVPQVIMTVGAMPSKPIKLGGTDQSFTDNASYRKYLQDNPNIRPVSKDSTWWRNHRDKSREASERIARKQGFTDLDAKHAHVKGFTKKGQKPRFD